MIIKEAIERILKKKNLSAEEMKSVFGEIMAGNAAHDEVKEFLTALARKGETVDEVTAAAAVMRERMTKVALGFDTILDTCGTGGGFCSFNISTTVALVAAGAGVKVAKHGNRSYTSHCGSADILERMGVKIDTPPDKAAACVKEVGMAFLFAPLYHSAMKNVSAVRREIKRRTIFNILGPLSNPAGANVQIVGAYDESLTDLLAEALNRLGSKRAFVVHGRDGFDEISISGRTKICAVKGGKVDAYEIGPADFGIKAKDKDDVACKDVKDNINALRSVLEGKRSARRDMVLVNASAALVAAGRAKDFKDGVSAASESIDSGKAKKILEALIKFTNKG